MEKGRELLVNLRLATVYVFLIMFTFSSFLTVAYAQSEQEVGASASASIVVSRSLFSQVKHGFIRYGVYGGFFTVTFLLVLAIIKGRQMKY